MMAPRELFKAQALGCVASLQSTPRTAGHVGNSNLPPALAVDPRNRREQTEETR